MPLLTRVVFLLRTNLSQRVARVRCHRLAYFLGYVIPQESSEVGWLYACKPDLLRARSRSRRSCEGSDERRQAAADCQRGESTLLIVGTQDFEGKRGSRSAQEVGDEEYPEL